MSTQAIVLHAFPYGESSKIVRLATPDLGVISAVAKGAHRARSRFGARIQPLSEGTVSVYLKQSRELQTLAEFDVTKQRAELARDVTRFAGAAALAELVLRCAPAEPHPQIYAILQQGLDWLSEAADTRVPAVALAGLWSVVGGLGFAPALESCAVDGNPLGAGEGRFSIPDGGFVCATCGASRTTRSLGEADRGALADFVAGRTPVEIMDVRHAAAHRRLIAQFIDRHLAEERQMHALHFWEHLD